MHNGGVDGRPLYSKMRYVLFAEECRQESYQDEQIEDTVLDYFMGFGQGQ